MYIHDRTGRLRAKLYAKRQRCTSSIVPEY